MGYKVKLGYYNGHQFPVQFSLRGGRSAPLALAAGEPIIDKAGFLVKPGQEELDEEVRLGTIAYIFADNPKHKDFVEHDKIITQRKTGTRRAVNDDGFPDDMTPVGSHPRKQKAHKPPETTVSAAHAPVETNVGDGPDAPGPSNVMENAQEQAESEAAAQASEVGIRPGEGLADWMTRQKAAGRLSLVQGNKFEFEGRVFNSKKALAKYLELALSPTPA